MWRKGNPLTLLVGMQTSTATMWRRQWQPTPVPLPGKIPRMEDPGGLQFMESQRVGHD